jgi:hypothetical protein
MPTHLVYRMSLQYTINNQNERIFGGILPKRRTFATANNKV